MAMFASTAARCAPEEVKANDHLLNAVPDLLAALQEALSVLVGVSDSHMALDIEAAIKQAHAALAKASGAGS